MANENTNAQDTNQLLKIRRDKLADLKAAGKDPYVITKFDQDTHTLDILNDFENYEGKTVKIAGRLMSKRVMGKASFCNIKDLKGSIQVYVCRDSLGEEAYADFKKMDIGDNVGITGFVFRT